MQVVRIKKTGQALYVSGKLPKKKGDRFEATDVLPTRPERTPGLQVVQTPGGGVAFSCTRGGSSYGYAGGVTRTYAFDPDMHEIEGEAT